MPRESTLGLLLQRRAPAPGARQRQPHPSRLRRGQPAPDVRGRRLRRLRRPLALIHATRFGASARPSPIAPWNAGARPAARKASRRANACATASRQRCLRSATDFSRTRTTPRLRERLADGQLPLPDFFGQLLRLVYRLIFLLAAEDRGLLHPPGVLRRCASSMPTAIRSEPARPAVRRAAWDRLPRSLGRIAHHLRRACTRRTASRPARARRNLRRRHTRSGSVRALESRSHGGHLPPGVAQGLRASCRSTGATWRPRNSAPSTKACSNSRRA